MSRTQRTAILVALLLSVGIGGSLLLYAQDPAESQEAAAGIDEGRVIVRSWTNWASSDDLQITAKRARREGDGPLTLEGDVVVTLTRDNGSKLTLRADRLTIEGEQ